MGEKSVPFGKYWRSRPLVFSFEPRQAEVHGFSTVSVEALFKSRLNQRLGANFRHIAASRRQIDTKTASVFVWVRIHPSITLKRGAGFGLCPTFLCQRHCSRAEQQLVVCYGGVTPPTYAFC